MVSINIRLDESTKEQLDEVCQELGLTVTGAFNVFARAVVRERRIPFELSLGSQTKSRSKGSDDGV